MKHSLTILLLLTLSLSLFGQSVGINSEGSAPHSSSILDISSNTKGVLFPRMTSAQRASIPSPATGLHVYDTDTKTIWSFNGTQWTNTSGGVLSLPFSGSANINTAAVSVSNDGVAIEGHGSWGNGVYATSNSGAGLNALSTSGFGIIASSVQNAAIYAFVNNSSPAISANNTNAQGTAITANSSNYHAILATTNGTSKSALRGEATGASGAGVFGLTSNSIGIGVYGNATNGGVALKGVSNTGYALDVYGKVKIAGGNTNPSQGAVLTSDASGNATWTPKVGFRASGVDGNNNYYNWTKIDFSNEEYDYGNNWNQLNGANYFIVPISGLYHFDGQIQTCWSLDGWFGATARVMLERNGTQYMLTLHRVSGDSDASSISSVFALDHELIAGDKIWLEASVGSFDEETYCLSTQTYAVFFNGRLIYKN